jgi:hypothetical protein
MNRISIIGCAGFVLAASACSSAPPVRTVTTVRTVAAYPHIGRSEAALIHAYYREQPRANGRGHGRKKGLPPGIAVNITLGKPLPPGIAKRALPVDLLRSLPPLPSGFEYAVVAGKVLLIEVTTQVVRDVLTETLLD